MVRNYPKGPVSNVTKCICIRFLPFLRANLHVQFSATLKVIEERMRLCNNAIATINTSSVEEGKKNGKAVGWMVVKAKRTCESFPRVRNAMVSTSMFF